MKAPSSIATIRSYPMKTKFVLGAVAAQNTRTGNPDQTRLCCSDPHLAVDSR